MLLFKWITSVKKVWLERGWPSHTLCNKKPEWVGNAGEDDVYAVTREDHAAYIASWLTALHHDKRFIFSEAHAQRTADFSGLLKKRRTGRLKDVDSAKCLTWALGKPPFRTRFVPAQKISRMLMPPEGG